MDYTVTGSSGSMSSEVPFHIGNTHIDALVGRVLTIIDASIADSIQRKALKDVLRDSIWEWINKEPRGEFRPQAYGNARSRE